MAFLRIPSLLHGRAPLRCTIGCSHLVCTAWACAPILHRLIDSSPPACHPTSPPQVWNKLDGTLVLLSVAEILVNIFLAGASNLAPILRMLRMLRIVRAVRALRKWKAMMDLIGAFVKAIPQVANLMILMFVLMFIFAIIGMQVGDLATSHHIPPYLAASPDIPSIAFADLPSLVRCFTHSSSAALAWPTRPVSTLTLSLQRCSPSSPS